MTTSTYRAYIPIDHAGKSYAAAVETNGTDYSLIIHAAPLGENKRDPHTIRVYLSGCDQHETWLLGAWLDQVVGK